MKHFASLTRQFSLPDWVVLKPGAQMLGETMAPQSEHHPNAHPQSEEQDI